MEINQYLERFQPALQGLGLTNGEIKVYLTLLYLNESTTGRIIEYSGLSSGKIYEILDKLIKKGLVSYIIKGKVKHFSSENPENMFEYIQKIKIELDTKEKQIKKIMPELKKAFTFENKEYTATIYEGIKSIKIALFDELLKMSPNDEYLSFGISLNRQKDILSMWKQFELTRVKRKVKAKFIIADQESFIDKTNWFLDSEKRFLKLPNVTPISIMNNIVYLFNWEETTMLKIVNKSMAKSFKAYFENLWKLSKSR